MSKNYTKNYYENGEELNISGYTNYRWLPDLTIPMCKSIIENIDIKKEHKILDFGCAKGFLVKAFTKLGYECYGTDISEYATKNSDKEVSNRVFLYEKPESISIIKDKIGISKFDLIISKDVFEHIAYEEIDNLINTLSNNCNRLFAVIPLGIDGKFIIEEYEKDITHIIREPIEWWNKKFIQNGFSKVTSTFKMKGIKENWSQFNYGNGFFIVDKN